MKNKVIKIFIVIIISFICSSLLNSSYAGDACRIKADLKPSNPEPGDEIVIDISSTYIHDPICGMSFSLEYDSEKLEYIGASATDFWDIKLTGTTFFVESKNGEATTSTGKIATIRLKVKDNVAASTENIKWTHIEVATDDGSSVNLEDLEWDITIQQKNETPNQNISGGNTNTSGQNTSNSNGSPVKNTNGGSFSDSIDESRIVTINGNSSDAESAKGSDTSTSSKSLPKTGYRSIIFLVIALTITGLAASYTLFKKYKNI